MAATCDEDHPDYDYYDCEKVHSEHLIIAHILLILTFVVGILVMVNAYFVYKYRHYGLIRFRCPRSIVVWSIVTEIYLFSRILYWFQLMDWFNHSTAYDIAKYSLNRLGLVGTIIVYLIRAWMYYVTYKYDQDLLNNQIDKNWLFSNDKFKRTIANEQWLLSTGIFVMVLLTILFSVCRYHDIEEAYYIVMALCFVLAVFILVLVFRFAHDQLGIRIEYISFVIVYAFALFGFFLITDLFEDAPTSKRIATWFGGLMLLFIGTALTFYFPFIRGGLYKVEWFSEF